MRCGMRSLLKIIGANNITQSTRKKIHVGSVMGRYVVIASKIKIFAKVRKKVKSEK